MGIYLVYMGLYGGYMGYRCLFNVRMGVCVDCNFLVIFFFFMHLLMFLLTFSFLSSLSFFSFFFFFSFLLFPFFSSPSLPFFLFFSQMSSGVVRAMANPAEAFLCQSHVIPSSNSIPPPSPCVSARVHVTKEERSQPMTVLLSSLFERTIVDYISMRVGGECGSWG